MKIRLEQTVQDWETLRNKFDGLELGIKLERIRAVHLQHETLTLKTLEEVRRALADKVSAGHGWLMLTDELVHLPASHPLNSGIPLQGEWHAGDTSWQLRYLGVKDGWKLHQYTVSDPDSNPDENKPATHLAEAVKHLKADDKGHIEYLRLWSIENDLNDEPSPTPVLSVLVGYGKEE